jgi:hypothetical protein
LSYGCAAAAMKSMRVLWQTLTTSAQALTGMNHLFISFLWKHSHGGSTNVVDILTMKTKL